jgi:hypothetical protein
MGFAQLRVRRGPTGGVAGLVGNNGFNLGESAAVERAVHLLPRDIPPVVPGVVAQICTTSTLANALFNGAGRAIQTLANTCP